MEGLLIKKYYESGKYKYDLYGKHNILIGHPKDFPFSEIESIGKIIKVGKSYYKVEDSWEDNRSNNLEREVTWFKLKGYTFEPDYCLNCC